MSRDNKLIFWSLFFWVSAKACFFTLTCLRRELGADPIQIGIVLSISMMVMTASFIPAGWLPIG